MNFFIRRARVSDAEDLLRVHRSAIKARATKYYDQATIEDWASPSSALAIKRKKMVLATDKKNTIVAEMNGKVVGFAEIVPEKNELRAVYVEGDAQGKGLGSALLAEIEKIARHLGITELHLDSSLMAVPFYLEHNYINEGVGTHTLRSGRKIACVKMRKIMSNKTVS